MSYNLITDPEDAIAIGTIKGYKPWYQTGRNNEPMRVGYIVTIKADGTIRYAGRSLPVFLQFLLFSGDGEKLRRLKQHNSRVKIIGKKRTNGQHIYRNKNDQANQSLWIFLMPDPIPKIILT